MAEASGISERVLARYDRLIATLANEGVERKGATMPYTSHNGHMFSFLTKEGKLAMRLDEEDIPDFIRRFGGRRCRQHGVVMKEYVEVPDDVLKQTSALAWFFGLSWMHVASMKPKATKRKSKTAVAQKKTAAKKKATKKKATKKKATKKKAAAKKKVAAKKKRT
jgi:hypothetical protein